MLYLMMEHIVFDLVYLLFIDVSAKITLQLEETGSVQSGIPQGIKSPTQINVLEKPSEPCVDHGCL
jgi:hypothetical protein